MAILFAFRSTDSSILDHVSNPIGLDNDFYLQKSSSEANLVIACWGNPGRLLNRDKSDKSFIISMKKIEEHRLFYFLSYLNPIALIETITVEIDIRTAAMRGSI